VRENARDAGVEDDGGGRATDSHHHQEPDKRQHDAAGRHPEDAGAASCTSWMRPRRKGSLVQKVSEAVVKDERRGASTRSGAEHQPEQGSRS
jgi:hypothetical protein